MGATLANLIRHRYGTLHVPLELELPDGGTVRFAEAPQVRVIARSGAGLRALARPALGRLATAYVHGDIDFTGEARRMVGLAERMVGEIAHGREGLLARARTWLHQQRDNRANIQHHYDVSNAFYRLWLDQRMVYSCAYFHRDGDSLDMAQAQKLDHICRKLRLAKGESFLDIGCGWGGLVFWAAEHYGVRATGITLSKNQFDHVRSEIARRGLAGRVDVRLMDYRHLPSDRRYEKIASVGMFEHVGVNRLPAYFRKIHDLLEPGGLVMNHGITHNWLGASSLGSGIGDFVERYVFPGGELTHVSRVIDEMTRAGVEVFDAEGLREHYARTLWHWTDRLESHAEAARREVGEARYRVWRIYMAGSAHAFDRGWLSLWQLLGGRPTADGKLPHPLTREYMYRPQPSVDTGTPMSDTPPPSPLTFPTDFPIKIMGRRTDNFAQTIVDVVREHAPDYDPATLEMRASREANYLSVTVTINATSREQLDNLYRALTPHPLVTMVL